MSHPRLGERVFYTLNEDDAEQINRRRRDAVASRAGAQDAKGRGPGYVVHVGGNAHGGDQLPATLVKNAVRSTWNLQVVLDGNDTYWATSRSEGQGPGTWQTRPSL